MKALLVILTICTIDTLCQGVKVSEKVYPKKYASGKILINSSKYEKAYKNAKHNISQKATLPSMATSYTGFSNIGNYSQMILAGIPDSPYFPIDPGYHQKSSVKKVVPEHPFSLILRRKRSADVSIVPPAEKDEKKIEPKAAEVQKETTQAPTATAESIKAETTVTPSSSPKEESKSATQITTTTKKPTERTGTAKPKKKLPAPARKGQPKSKAAAKRKSKLKKKGVAVRAKPKAKKGKSAVVRAKPKAKKGKSAAVRAKPKAKKGKSAVVRAKPKAKKGKSAAVRAKPKTKTGKKNLQRLRPSKTKTIKRKRKGSDLQRSKNQKAKKPKNARTRKPAPKGKKQGRPTKTAKKPK